MRQDCVVGESADVEGRSARRGAVSRWVEGRVVVYHDHPVSRQMHVEFDPVGTVLEGPSEPRQGVLGSLPRRPAVSDDFEVASSVRCCGVGWHRAKVDQPLDT